MSLLTVPAALRDLPPASGRRPHRCTPGTRSSSLACMLGILAVVVLITWGKVHPFLALMLGSAVLGAVATMPPGDTVKSFVAGFGATAGAVGILIALGAMIGKLLEDSGGANRIVASMVSRVGPGRPAVGDGGDRGHPRACRCSSRSASCCSCPWSSSWRSAPGCR